MNRFKKIFDAHDNHETVSRLVTYVRMLRADRTSELYREYREYISDSIKETAKYAYTVEYHELEQQKSPNPTFIQRIRQQFKRPRVWLFGQSIEIENLSGSFRTGINEETGKRWKVKLLDHYGFFTNTIGEDAEEVDVWVNSNVTEFEIEKRPVFIIEQYKSTGEYDEDKVILGANNASHAKNIYMRNYRNVRMNIKVKPIPSLEVYLNEYRTY